MCMREKQISQTNSSGLNFRVAVCDSQRVAVCCSVLQCVVLRCVIAMCVSVLQCVAVCCVAVCYCDVCECVAVCG